MSWPCCPVCKRLTFDGKVAKQAHMEACPWEAMEKRVKELEDRCTTLMRLVLQLDQRTIGSLR